MKLKKQRDLDRISNSFAPSIERLKQMQKCGLVNHVIEYPTSVAEIYCWCKVLNLPQATFEAARKIQLKRLSDSLKKIANG